MKDDIEAFKKFKAGVLNFLSEPCGKLNQNDTDRFHSLLGITIEDPAPYAWGDARGNVFGLLKKENDPQVFYKMLEELFKLKSFSPHRNDVINKTNEMIRVHKINITINNVDGEIILRPCGEALLDDELVEEALSFLNPESQKHFLAALKGSKKSKDDCIKSAESIRRCIEEFLRFKLNRTNNLALNITDLGKKLKEKSTSKELSNIIVQTFSHLEKYFNQHSKHNDGDIGEHESEFLIYQSALLMRYIHKKI